LQYKGAHCVATTTAHAHCGPGDALALAKAAMKLKPFDGLGLSKREVSRGHIHTEPNIEEKSP